MALDPKKKAQVCLDLAAGMSVRAAAKKHGVATATVTKLSKEIAGVTGQTPVDRKLNAFDEKVKEAANTLLDAIMAQARFSGNESWLATMTAKDGGVDDVNKFSDATMHRLICIIEFAQRGPTQRDTTKSIGPSEEEAIEPDDIIDAE